MNNMVKMKLYRQTIRILLATGYQLNKARDIADNEFLFLDDPLNEEDLYNINKLQEDVYNWTKDVFGDEKIVHERPAEIIQSLLDEAKELSEKPYSIYEFADLFITFLNSLSAANYTFSELLVTSRIKMIINKGRKWFRKGTSKIIYHKERNEL